VIYVSGSALLVALWPTFGVVAGAKVLHAVASCLFGPVLAAISLGLVGYSLLSERLGRNVRFLSLGNAIAAGVMGGVGYYFSNQAIFFLTAALAVPTLVALLQIRPGDIDPDLARGGIRWAESRVPPSAFRSLLQNRALLIFAGAVLLFQFANAAALPIMAGLLTMRAPETATLILSICIFAPQFVVAAIAPLVGRKAQSWGRRPLLMLCFIATTSDPYTVIAAQLLDGISAATLGVLVPLVIADVMRGSGHFNLAQGTVGAAVGLGASFSTALAGFVADSLGSPAAFLFLAGIAACGLALVVAVMPETRDLPAKTQPRGHASV
jgi:predicted MFS family arabinose efflux permease